MTLWHTMVAFFASLAAEPAAVEQAHPPAAAAVAIAYAAQAVEEAPPAPTPPAPPPPAPKPPCPQCGGLGKVLRAGPSGERIERCPCGACPNGTCPRPSGA